MPSPKIIKQRIKSTKSTSQITKAMEVVSATKMRRAQEFALGARPYAIASLEILHNVLAHTTLLPSLLAEGEVKNSLLVVLTSDKCLAGAFNANVLRRADEWIASKREEGKIFSVVTIGKKAKDYFERKNISLEASFLDFGDYAEISETLPVSELVISGYQEGKWDEVYALYTHFRTTLIQEASLKRILPVTEEGIKEAVIHIVPEHGRYSNPKNQISSLKNQTPGSQFEYKYEPSPEGVLSTLVPQLIAMRVHHIILESNASEHSARMVAMKNASDNAKELINNLNLAYNKARQSNITREIVEIVAGAEAL
ncbi:MAG TPA: ATP synthase F1 subunit gamma [Candidatus Paceibacterota bacterium]